MNRVAKKFLNEASYLTGKYFVSPQFVSLQITFKCNFKCQACSIWKKSFPELNNEEWLEIASDIKKYFPENTFVEINGGEPLLRKELVFKLIKSLKKKFKTVTLNSNGSLIGCTTLRKLEEAGLDAIKISFYSLRKKTVNSLRGTEDAYGKTLDAIRLLQNSNIKLEIGVLITSENIDDLEELITYLQKLKNCQIILQPLDESIESEESKKSRKNILPKNLWPQKDKVQEFFKWLRKNSKNIKNSKDNLRVIENYYLLPRSALKRKCFAGQKGFMVYPNGNVSFCFKRKNIGNINNDDIAKILKSSNTRSERKGIKNCRKYCRISGCNYSRRIREYF